MKLQLKLSLTPEIRRIIEDHLTGELRRSGLATDKITIESDGNDPTRIRFSGTLTRNSISLEELNRFAIELAPARFYINLKEQKLEAWDVPLSTLGIELAVK